MLTVLQSELDQVATEKKKQVLERFFKTGPGHYGEGDVFIGVRVPEIRQIIKGHRDLDEKALERLLKASIHEYRLAAVLLLVERFKKAKSETGRKAVYTCYEKNIERVNNWDLVDLSAPYITGPYLYEKSRKPLFTMAQSPNLWRRRVAIVSSFYFIRQEDFEDTLRISDALLTDEHDLIHKAVGWMLREVGKRDLHCLETFLKPRYQKMPRTMLRYAIERFEEPLRQRYLKSRI